MKNTRDSLGFNWDSAVIPENPIKKDIERVCFRVKKLFPEFVWDTTVLEDNPFTFPEVKTLLEGVTVGGHKLSDEQQVLNQAVSLKYLLGAVTAKTFTLSKGFFCELNSLVSKEEGLTWGVFRDGAVSIAGTKHNPPPADKLEHCFGLGLSTLEKLTNPLERGLCFFLFAALHQFFYDGNKRSGRLMMNGILLTAGLDAITIPAKEKQTFNEKMVRFYDQKDGTEMMSFLLGCMRGFF